jgi:hypothetical protein
MGGEGVDVARGVGDMVGVGVGDGLTVGTSRRSAVDVGSGATDAADSSTVGTPGVGMTFAAVRGVKRFQTIRTSAIMSTIPRNGARLKRRLPRR